MIGGGNRTRSSQQIVSTLTKIDEKFQTDPIISVIKTKATVKLKKMVYGVFYVTSFSFISFQTSPLDQYFLLQLSTLSHNLGVISIFLDI